MNIAFCGWLWARAHLRGDRLEVMIHEPYLAFGEGSLRQDVVAMVHRVMAVILLHSASKIWVSIPAWDAYCRPYLIRRRTPIEWLPIPSSIEISSDSTPIEGIRRRYLGKSRFLLGHFGIHGSLTTQALRRILAPVLDRCPTATMLFIGKGSEEFRDKVLSEWPRFLGRVEAAGMLAPAELSQTLSACDLMLQPYPDGVSSRRTSAMAALVHGIPMLTTTGHLSEDFWEHSGAVATVPAGDSPAFVEATLQLLEDTEKRSAIGSRASKLYRETFDINHVTGKLRRTSAVD